MPEIPVYWKYTDKDNILGFVSPDGELIEGKPATYSTDSSGNVTGLVNPSGGEIGLQFGYGKKVLLLGDSITANHLAYSTYNTTTRIVEPTSSYGNSTLINGYANVANSLLGNPYQFIVSGFSGAKSEDALSNIQVVLRDNEDICELWLYIGVNDASQSVSAATASANIIAIINYALSNALRVVWIPAIPQTSAGTMTATTRNLLIQTNHIVKRAVVDLKNVDILDVASVLIDYSNANGYMAANNAYDVVHPSNAGGFFWGLALYNLILYRAPVPYPAISSPVDDYAVDNNSNQLLSDPLLLGATSASAGTGVTGTQLTALTIQRLTGGASDTCISSIISAPDGIGNAQRLVFTAGTGACSFRCIQAANVTKVVAGGRYYVECYVQVSNVTNFEKVSLSAEGSVTSITYPTPFTGSLLNASTAKNINYTGTVIFKLRTPIITIPADATAINYLRNSVFIYFSGIGGGTIDIYRRAVYKIN